MKQLPSLVILLDSISSKELATELDKLPESAIIERVNNTLVIYF